MKIISRGRARKNETDSRREFPGSRILADLWLDHINEFIELIRRVGQRIRSWGVVTIFGKTPNMYLHITQNVSPNVSLNLPNHQICHEVCPQIHHQIWCFTKIVNKVGDKFVTKFGDRLVTKFVTKFAPKFITKLGDS